TMKDKKKTNSNLQKFNAKSELSLEDRMLAEIQKGLKTGMHKKLDNSHSLTSCILCSDHASFNEYRTWILPL
ncbi:hypothetical protein PanWU01x14_309050, partial [Parasponia andersonii]